MDDHKYRHIDNNFLPYISQLHDWKYTNSQYYKQILHEYYIKNPHNDYKQAYEYLSANIRHQQQNIIKQMNMPWKLLSFDNVWRDIKTKYNGVQRKRFTKKNKQKGIDLLNIIMINLKQSEIFTLLNKISHDSNHKLPNILHIPWGDCIRSIISVIEVIKKLNKYFRNKIAMKAKQTILSALADVSNVYDENLLLKQPLLRKIHPNIKKCDIDELIQCKLQFINTQTCLSLYNIKYDGKFRFTKKSMPDVIINNIIKYWIDNSDPSPNYQDSRIIGKDHNNNKIRHQIHAIKETITEFYEQWKIQTGTAVCLECGRNTASQSTFYRLKPIFIRCSMKIDYNLCMQCFNFENMKDAYFNMLEQNHICKSIHCAHYDDDMGQMCSCNDCTNCILFTELIHKSKLDFIRGILCGTDEFANVRCINSKCSDSKCGAKIIDAISNNVSCHTNTVNPNAIVTYSFIKKVSYEYGKDKHLIQTINMKWCDFLWEFTKNMRKFIIHSSSKRNINRVRAHLAGTNDKSFLLSPNAVVRSFDFIGRQRLSNYRTHLIHL